MNRLHFLKANLYYYSQVSQLAQENTINYLQKIIKIIYFVKKIIIILPSYAVLNYFTNTIYKLYYRKIVSYHPTNG